MKLVKNCLPLGLLLFAVPAHAGTATVCYESICRTVEIGELPSPTQDTSRMPVKAPKQRIADWKFWTVTAVSVGLSVTRTVTVTDCRNDHGIGQCAQGGYGEYKTREALEQGLTAGLTIASYFLKKTEDENDSKFKFWWTFPLVNAGINAAVISENATRQFHPKEID